mgnify:CR=1 FL=1
MKWVTEKFDDFVKLNRGFDLPNDKIVEGEYPVVASTDIKAYHNAYKVEGPGVVTGRSGSLGTVQYIRGKCWPLNTSLFVKDFKGNDPRFVYYYLQIMHLENYNAGAGVPTLNQNHLHKIKIRIPESLIDQQKLASILSRYDDLIEVNNRRIALLEASARELYKEWFVRFRFPGYETAKFVDGLPEGWEKVAIGEVVSIIVGGDKPVDCEKQPTSTCTIPVYANGETDKGLMGYTSSARVTENCVTVSARGNVGFVCLRRKPFTPIVRLLAVIPKAQVMNELYLYQYLKSSQLFATGAAQQQITAPLLNKETIIVPRRETLFDFFKHCNKFYNTIEALEYQNSLLSAQRDRLLPRLLSGDLSVD